MSTKVVRLRQHGIERNATSGRLANSAYRIREHLTEAEMEKLLAALKRNRHGHRDWLIGLLIYRHGLRVSEACDLRWDDIDLSKRTITVRRLKGSTDSVHYLERERTQGARIRTGGSRNGYAAAPALSWTRLDHQYGEVHGDVAGAVQRRLALISAGQFENAMATIILVLLWYLFVTDPSPLDPHLHGPHNHALGAYLLRQVRKAGKARG